MVFLNMRLLCETRVKTVIDAPLENAIHMHSVWAAWFQFWRKQHHLRIDVLFFLNTLNEQRSSNASSGFNWTG